MFCPSCNYNLNNLPTNTCPECGHPFDPSNPSTFRRKPESPLFPLFRRAVYTLIALVLCGVVATIALVIHSARQSMLAEERLQATALICDLLAEHVEQSPTHAWPASWADLEKLPPRQRIWRWPEDAAKFKATFTINFTLTTPNVLKQTPATCTAITLTPGPDYVGPTQRELDSLFNRLRAATTTPPSP